LKGNIHHEDGDSSVSLLWNSEENLLELIIHEEENSIMQEDRSGERVKGKREKREQETRKQGRF
jgi:hypothetical protein